MVRRLVAAGAAVVLVIVIALLVNSCKQSQKQSSLKEYTRQVSQLGRESETQVAHPLFAALSGAGGKPALNVEVQVDQLRIKAQSIATHAKELSVPSEMAGAQRNLLLALNFRVEGVTKIAALLPTALGGQRKEATEKIAGQMEVFLASDVIYSQRVGPLVTESLAANSIHGLTPAPSRFLPNIGWLDPAVVLTRITGQAAGVAQTGIAPGNHGDALLSVSVGTTTLEPEPALNHIGGGGNPTFTVAVEDAGANPETNVKVDVTVTAGGKQFKASHTINQIQPQQKTNVEIPVSGVPLGVAAKVEVYVEPVPGENEVENNKRTYLAIFGP
ncbi:MAG TPA: hypothetical protein VHY83_10360 [Solirubrobacteraceae bacterium]|jgi:uncharacterized protein with FMN-binding domain|nr:hypothetical protein [Solirubrobacteraceae bacterium]